MDSKMDKRTDRWINKQIYGRRDCPTEGQTDGWADGRSDGRTDRWTGGRMDRHFFAYGLITTTSILLIICLFNRLTHRNQYPAPRLVGKLVIMVWYFSCTPKATMASGRSLPLDNILSG